MDSTRPLRIGKYLLEHEIGKGGMGEVYFARDTDLERPVAIKLIRRERLDDPDIRRLFEKEAKATARLQHPAIVRIYDFLRWQDYECLVMEYLEGRSFKVFLQANEDRTPEHILPLFLDIAEGLAHAHDQGIIHRDLKPGNLWITPEKQVKILDFGIAKHTEQDTSMLDGRVVGTLDYMSPQQANGERLDRRSDLFSLGIILCEALTGSHPFRGESAQETLANIKAARQVPTSDQSVASSEISTLIHGLLAKQPSQRPDSAHEVADILSTAIGEPRSAAPPRPRRWLLGHGHAAAALLVATILLAAYLSTPWGPTARPSVVVLTSQSLGDSSSAENDDAWISTAVAEILTAHLGAGNALRALPSLHSAHVSAPQALTRDALDRLRAAFRVDHFVLGHTTRIDETWQVRIRLVDRDQGKVRVDTTIETTNAEAELESLLEDAARVLGQALGQRAPSPSDLDAARVSFPDGVAGRHYAEGVTAHRRHDLRAARVALEQAIANRPEAPMPHFVLAIVLTALGERQEAEAAGGRAAQRAERLGRVQRDEISARNAAFAGDWQTAADFYRANVERAPDVLSHGRGLAEALLYLGQAEAALEQITALREISLSRFDDGRLDLLTSHATFRLGVLSRARAAAMQAVAIGEAMAAPRLAAEGGIALSMTLDLLGQRRAARHAWDAAHIAATRTSDRRLLLDIFRQNIESLLLGGNIAEALDQFELHREYFRGTGDGADEAFIAYDLATAMMGRDPDVAASLLSDARATFTRLDLPGDVAVAEFGLGALAQMRGRLAAAATHYQIALEIFTELGDPIYRAAVTTSLGELAFFAADFDSALDLHRRSLAINRELPYPAGIAYDTFRIAETLRHQGDLETAHAHYAEALEDREALGEVESAAETRIGLARLELARKNYGNASREAEKASAALLAIGSMDFYVLARITEAEIYLAQGDRGTSLELLDESELHARASVDRRVGFEVRLLTARTSEDAAEREKVLEAVVTEATRGGDLLYAREARQIRTSFSAKHESSGE